MANIVTVLLQAKDQISPAVAGIKGKLMGLSSNMGNVPGGGILGSLNLGGVAVSGALAGLAAVTGAVVLLKNQISTAAEAQTATIASAGDVATLTGASFDKAKASVLDLRQSIAKSAASLPGETAGFTTIANKLMPAIAGSTGGDLKKLNEETLELTKSLGVLSAVKKGDSNQAGMTAAKFIGGKSSLKELQQNDLFQNNPLLIRKIEEKMKLDSLGDDITKLTERQRIDLLKFASKAAMSPEVLAQFDGTAESYIQGAMTMLFDPDVGMFGFLKPLKALGNRTGIEAVSQLFGALTTLVAKIGKAVGFDADGIMVGIVQFTDWLTSVIHGLTAIVSGGDMADMDIAQLIGNIFSDLSDWFNESIIGGINSGVSSIDWGKLGEVAGLLVGNLFVSVQKIDWVGVIGVVIKGFIGVGQFVMGFMKSATLTVITGLLSALWERLQSIFNFIVQVFRNLFSGLSTVINWFIEQWTGFWKRAADAFMGMFGGISTVVNWFGDQFKSLWQSAIDTIKPIVDSFVSGVKSTIGVISNPGQAIQSGTQSLEDSINRTLGLPTKADQDKQEANKKAKESTSLPTVPVPSQNSASTFAPQINLQANANMGTADQVDLIMQAINDKYREYQQGAIA